MSGPSIEELAGDLQRQSIFDSGMLKSGGRAEVLTAIDQWRRRGRNAYVLMVNGEPLAQYHALWDAMKLNPQRDLLLLFNGRQLEGRGWGLAGAHVSSMLKDIEGAHEYFGRKVVRALDQLGNASLGGGAPGAGQSGTAAAKGSSSTGWSTVGLTAGGVALVGGGGLLALAVRRRNQLAKEAQQVFGEATQSAEAAYAELIVALEQLPGGDGTELQLRAADLKQQFDRLIERASGDAKAMRDPVTLGKMRQFENEFAALRSTELQKARQACSVPESRLTSPAQKPTDEWDPSNGSEASLEAKSISEAAKRN